MNGIVPCSNTYGFLNIIIEESHIINFDNIYKCDFDDFNIDSVTTILLNADIHIMDIPKILKVVEELITEVKK